jgi:RNA polymerase sigma factor for flagellar operon FliA
MSARVERMIHDHIWLAETLAHRVWRGAPHVLDREELLAIAYLGLVGAAQRWEPYCEERGYSPDATQWVKTFLGRRIQGALIDALRTSDWAKRKLRARAKRLQAAGQSEGLSYEELAERSGMSVAEVRATLQAMTHQPISLERAELVLVADVDVESTVEVSLILGRLNAAIRALPFEQQAVVALHYLDGLQLQQIAQVMNIAEGRASELHTEAALALHEVMKTAVGGHR